MTWNLKKETTTVQDMFILVGVETKSESGKQLLFRYISMFFQVSFGNRERVLLEGHDIAFCASCSLSIRVLFEFPE